MEERDRKRTMNTQLRQRLDPLHEDATPDKADTHFLSALTEDGGKSPFKMDVESKLKPEDLEQIAQYKSKLRKRSPNTYQAERYDFEDEPFGKALKPNQFSNFFFVFF